MEFVASSFPDYYQRHSITSNIRTIQEALNILNKLEQQEVRSLAARPIILTNREKHKTERAHTTTVIMKRESTGASSGNR